MPPPIVQPCPRHDAGAASAKSILHADHSYTSSFQKQSMQTEQGIPLLPSLQPWGDTANITLKYAVAALYTCTSSS